VFLTTLQNDKKMLSQQATVSARSLAELSQRLIKFKNCRILRNHKIIREDLWVRNGKIINPEKIFFDEKRQAHVVSFFCSSYCFYKG
jgi:N-acetylglucosamine-6-phosphate deacetylase